MSSWALDLGTTNSLVARWDPEAGRPRVIELPRLWRTAPAGEELLAPLAVPSATHVPAERSLLARLGGWGPLARHTFLGTWAIIGRPALERNAGWPQPGYAPSFKAALLRSGTIPLARRGRSLLTARDVAGLFLRELLAEVRRVTGVRLRQLTLTTPTDSYETYRAELQGIAARLGVDHLRFLDEPVAAALGYGLGLQRERRVLVVDFGGGTLHATLVQLTPGEARLGRCRVLAKAARLLGGNDVDRWLLEEVCRRLGSGLPEGPAAAGEASLWWSLMLAEACRVKEALFLRPAETFHLVRPEEVGAFPGRILPPAPRDWLELTPGDLQTVLEQRGLYRTLEQLLAEVALTEPDPPEEVLLVGGSTLLPGVHPLFEARHGRAQVRAWQPFEAVVLGACAHAADRFATSDFLLHDYAFLTHDPRTHEPEYTVILPAGTRIPTPPDCWKGQLVPTCSLGRPETFFALTVCELGTEREERIFVWDAEGRAQREGGPAGPEGRRRVVPLNAAHPTLGHLRPPHRPGDQRPRLEVSFGVDGERWLRASVLDLRTRRWLLREEPVVRIL